LHGKKLSKMKLGRICLKKIFPNRLKIQRLLEILSLSQLFVLFQLLHFFSLPTKAEKKRHKMRFFKKKLFFSSNM